MDLGVDTFSGSFILLVFYDKTLACGLCSLIMHLICNSSLPLLGPGLVLLFPKLGCFKMGFGELVDQSFRRLVLILE